MPFPALFAIELKNLENKNAAKNCFSVYDLVRATIGSKKNIGFVPPCWMT